MCASKHGAKLEHRARVCMRVRVYVVRGAAGHETVAVTTVQK